MERYGYIRVSAKDQNPERQFLAMQEQHIKKKNIYLDKISVKSFVRPQYLQLLKRLKKGDIVIIKSMDRLGRNYEEILEQWRKITKEIGADIQVIDMPLLNTEHSAWRSDRGIHCRSGAPDLSICGRNGKGIYQTETGRGDRSGSKERNPVRL